MSLVIAVVAVVTLLATAATVVGGSFRVARNTAVVANYRDAAKAWEAKATAQESEISELRSELSEREKELIDLRSQVAVLRDMVTGKNAVEQILPQINSIRDDLMRAIRDMHHD